MGIQVYFDRSDVVKAGLKVELETVQHPNYYCCDSADHRGHICAHCGDTGWEDFTAIVGDKHFHYWPEEGKLWLDANHWGNNRKWLIPWLEKNNIPYYEG